MKKTNRTSLVVPEEVIESKIYFIRERKIMFDHDLPRLYEVETRRLKEQVKRNLDRFPEDFMFKLSKDEYRSLRSQFATLKRGQHSKYLPYAFTEQGVAMLSSVLNSKRAIQVNIQIMRIFTRIKEMLRSHEDLRRKIEAMERKYDHQFRIVFEAIKRLLEPSPKPRRQIGFRP